MRLFDTHCHLQDERLIADAEGVIERAHAAGVSFMLCCGSAESDWDDVLALSRRFSSVIPALGIHPWYAGQRSGDWLKDLEAALVTDESIAVGEIGLDHALELRNDNEQMVLFYKQLSLARKLHRPASIHCRKAWGSLMELLRREPGIARGSVIHSYSGPVELIDELRKHGLTLSFSGAVTYPRNKRVREAVKRVNSNYLLMETDSPDIAPMGHVGRNEPYKLIDVADALAQLRDKSLTEIAEDAFSVACRIFGRTAAV